LLLFFTFLKSLLLFVHRLLTDDHHALLLRHFLEQPELLENDLLLVIAHTVLLFEVRWRFFINALNCLIEDPSHEFSFPIDKSLRVE